MLELHISDTDVSSGTVPITWCLDKETLEELAYKRLAEPVLVICIAPVNGYHITKEIRKVVPIKDLLTYMEFQCAGENKIYGIVCSLNKKDAENLYLNREAGKYTTSVLTHDGTDYAGYYIYEQFSRSTPLMVEVPKDCFAAEPPEWEKAWVNYFFRNKPIDQCNFRKRRILAYTFQPLFFLFFTLFKLPALLIALLIADVGIWKVIKAIFQPLTYGIPDAWNSLDGTVLVNSWKTEEMDFDAAGPLRTIWLAIRKIMFLPLMPIVMMVLGVLWHFHKLLFVLQIAGITIGLLISALLFLYFLLGDEDNKKQSRGSRFVRFLGRKIQAACDWFNKTFPAHPEKEEGYQFWYQNPESQTLLVCSPEKKPLTIQALPPKHRTMKLRFSALKSQVCRPFSR